MADYSQGDFVREYFAITDTSGTELSGVTFTIEETLDPDASAFSLSISEVGGGTYKAEFLASKVGTYYWRIVTSSVSPNPSQTFEGTYVIGPFSLYGSAVGTSAYGVQLGRLVEMTAGQIADYYEVTASENGALDGTSLTDNERLSAMSPGTLKGAELTIISPTSSDNYMVSRRVADSSEANASITLARGFPAQILAGDTGILTNINSRGFHFSQYRRAINNAIVMAFPHHLIPLEYTYPTVFRVDDPTIPLPQNMTHIYGVSFYNLDGNTLDLGMSLQNDANSPGWSVDIPTATVRVNSLYYQSWIDGWNVRLLGYGRPVELSSWEEFTTVDAEWIVQRAAGALKWAKQDQSGYPIAANLENMASEGSHFKIMTPMAPGTIRVR